MRHIYVYILLCFSFIVGGSVFAASSLQEILEGYDAGLEIFMEKQYITRYDMTKYMAAGTCTDCLVPDGQMQDTYTNERLVEKQGAIRYNIDDMAVSTMYNGQNYWYCVADTIETGLMYGYPKNTSPYCPGKFCGDSTARYLEVVESIYRLARQSIYEGYTANWGDIAERTETRKSKIPVRWQAIIQENKDICKDEVCELTSATELDIYMLYCSAEMSACNLPVYRSFPAGAWPSGPFTALVKAGIIPPSDSEIFTLHDFVDPATFLGYLGSVYELQGCVRNKDYDGDNRINTKDNCPLTYNPHQYNEDKDAFGNVCDDDIDNDGLVNPRGIVNDANMINPRLWQETEDVSLFIPQSGGIGEEEKDNGAHNFGNEGDTETGGDINKVETGGDDGGDYNIGGVSDMMALKIHATPRVGPVDLTVTFGQEFVGTLTHLDWDFGDGTKGSGLDPVHTYTSPGLYVAKATATMFNTKKIVAHLHVNVQEQTSGPEVLVIGTLEDVIGYTDLDGGPLTGAVGEIFSFELTTFDIPVSSYARLIRDCGDPGMQQTYTQNIADAFTHECVYALPGSKRVNVTLYTDDGTPYLEGMTIYVYGNTSCLDNPEQYVCDMDEDGLPDMCDDDIDGDGIFNCLGLLHFEQESCEINQININEILLANCYEAIRDGADFDTCPFILNPEQEDADGDGYGDVCDPSPTNPSIPDDGDAGDGGNGDPDDENSGDGDSGDPDGDDDGDGIPNDEDACDNIPESGDGSQDADGCPELPDEGDDDRPSNPYVEPEACTACPCPHADYGSELWKGDRIRALLLDEAGEVIYRYTKPEIIEADIPDEMLGG